jgi:uncharacterized protein (DUF885 family)
MRNSLFLLSLIAIVVAACTSTSDKTDQHRPDVSFQEFLDQYYENRLRLYPFEATSAGDDRYNHVLHNDITLAFRDSLRRFYSTCQEQLNKYDIAGFSENDKLSYEVLNWTCTVSLKRLSFNEHLTPLNQFWSLPLTMGVMASGKGAQPFKTVKDYDNWFSRLEYYLAWTDTAMANMRKGISLGYVIPKVLVERTIAQLEPFAKGPVQEHLFYQPILNFPESFSEKERERLTIAYTDMVGLKIIPRYKKLVTFLRNEYYPACRESSGISEIPNGKDYYDLLITLYTTTQLSADEIFDLGEREVARITAEMELVKAQVGFKGTLQEFFVHLREKKDLMPFTKPEEVIENFNRIHEKMKPNLARLFKREPKTPFEVRRTEAFREASASASYSSGSLDGTRPGIFYVPIPDVKKYNIISDEDLFLHEAIPGHHYQISLQRENKDLPRFRKTSGYSAFAEGWALYTESLGKELGLYDDPYQYFGMLSAEMHRAIRLVVDAGIHSKGWTREQAIKYSLDHEAEDERSVTAEIERYMAIPGQALSYKIGQLKIRELRGNAEASLGDAFDVAEFHDQILNAGNLPLSILEHKIDRWIDNQRK